MHVTKGYRDLTEPMKDHNVYGRQQDCPSGVAVTRVIPDCGHTYFLQGHSPEPHSITSICRRCQLRQI